MFDGMTVSMRLKLEVAADTADAVRALAASLSDHRSREAKGELWLTVPGPAGAPVRIWAGGDYLLDAELVARIERLPGIASARLGPAGSPAQAPRAPLRLVASR